MQRTSIRAGLRRTIEGIVAAGWTGPPIARDDRHIRRPADGRWLRLTIEPDRAVVACHAPRTSGAGAALALAGRVTALFRGRTVGRLRFEAPSIDLDGHDPDGFRAVVTVPIRLLAAG